MLVLSRKEKDRILFPDLGVAVQFLRLASNQIRVGIEAPPEVHILRGELADPEQIKQAEEAADRKRHTLRNRLNAVTLALHLIQKQLEAGLQSEAEETLRDTLAEFSELKSLLDPENKSPRKPEQSPPAKRALIVEDNAQERELLAGFLRLSGYEVDVAEDGEQAMEYLKAHESPDVVLLDMHLPRMNGPETLHAIRRDAAHKDIKVFAVTGSDQKTIQVNWSTAKVDRWFSKPLNPDAFVHELNEAMG